ncbi:hypothetical protein [Mixta calida]|uniref:hypothetical protein n=1 Tax=Mixta calida TaxID=665913 RepID=UPI0034D45BF1
MKIIPLLLLVSGVGSAWAADALPEAENLTWRAITFGQSTDKNFATNVLPEKIGVNQVTFAEGEGAAQPGRLRLPVTVESRGGKIGNSHDGLTFYYTQLPASANMTLEAEVSIDQFGPENGAKPAGQEGAGLLARDVLGKPRLENIQPGYEEFPAASNMVMNAIMTQDKASHHRVQAMLIARNGVTQSWGNTGVEIKRQPYQQNIDLNKTPRFRLRLARSDEGFSAAWAPVGSDSWVTQQTGDADRLTVLDNERYYVGFFAARNARMTVHQAQLTLTPRHAAPGKKFVAKTQPAHVEIASATVATSSDYPFRLRSDRDGVLTVNSGGVERVRGVAVKAGEMFSVSLTLKAETTPVSYTLALRNVNNGFKLGGEGIPVAHRISDSVAIENGMDGFTDNFNPGALWVKNNIAVDNKRFNFIFRPGPYTQPEKQGNFENNISLRSKPGMYADAVTGNIDVSNAFLKSEKK